MALLGASFQIGRSALTAYQSAIAISGQNIANVGNPDYARQSGHLSALVGGPVLAGVKPGAGVRLDALQRHVDEALEARLRLSLGQRDGAEVVHRTLSQTEAIYGELTDRDVSTQLSEFFASFSYLQTSPNDPTSRNLILSAADTLLSSLHRQRSGLLGQVRDMNSEAIAAVEHANGLASELASLNRQIVAEEADGRSVASPLRDRRDALLRDLAGMMGVVTREQPNGAVNIYVGSEPLVEFNRSRGLAVETTYVDGVEIGEVRFADNGGTVNLSAGTLAGVVEGREHVRDQLARLDRLTGALIYEVNRLHSSGVGEHGYQSLLGTYGAQDPDAALDASDNLPFSVQNGTFIVHVRDVATGQVSTRQIEVDLDGLGGNDTSLTDLAAALNAAPGISASVTTDNRLRVEADGSKELWFTEDSSGALAALGVASFFTGTDASNADVAAALRSDPSLIASGFTATANDGDNAGRIAGLADATSVSALLGNVSISTFHSSTVGDLAVETASALSSYEAADAVYGGLYAQREAVGGVSLDEEAINLSKYEKAFQGAARYIGVLDEMTNQLLTLV